MPWLCHSSHGEQQNGAQCHHPGKMSTATDDSGSHVYQVHQVQVHVYQVHENFTLYFFDLLGFQ